MRRFFPCTPAKPGATSPVVAYATNDGRSATVKGSSRLHAPGDPGWDALRAWFYPAVAGLDPDTQGPMAAAALRFLDSPHQVIIETPAELVVGFNYAKFGASMRAGPRLRR